MDVSILLHTDTFRFSLVVGCHPDSNTICHRWGACSTCAKWNNLQLQTAD